MSRAHLLHFGGRAIVVRLSDESVREPDTAARHVEALGAAMRGVAAVAQELNAGAEQRPDARHRLHGLLVSLEVLASLCCAVGDAASPRPVGDS